VFECLKPICTPFKKVCENSLFYICEMGNYLQQKLCPLDNLQQMKENYFYGQQTEFSIRAKHLGH